MIQLDDKYVHIINPDNHYMFCLEMKDKKHVRTDRNDGPSIIVPDGEEYYVVRRNKNNILECSIRIESDGIMTKFGIYGAEPFGETEKQ